MPAKSVQQRKFFGMVAAAKKGKLKNVSPAIKKAAKSMSKKQADEFAKTKEKGLPIKVKTKSKGRK